MEDFEVSKEPQLRRHLQKRIRCLLNLGLFETPRALLASLGTHQLEEAVSMTTSLIEQGNLIWHAHSAALFTWLELCATSQVPRRVGKLPTLFPVQLTWPGLPTAPS